jgi:hypothetical protein
MGTNIHGILEIKWSHSNRWESIMPVDQWRNYALFAALAGVRNYLDLEPISEPRGVPDGFDNGKAEDFMRSRGEYWGDHHYSWLTLKELREWDGWDQIVKYGDGESSSLRELCATFLAWLEYAWLHCKTFFLEDEARVVFCFDS